MLRRRILAAPLLCALPAAAQEARLGDLTVTGGWSRAAGAGGTGALGAGGGGVPGVGDVGASGRLTASRASAAVNSFSTLE